MKLFNEIIAFIYPTSLLFQMIAIFTMLVIMIRLYRKVDRTTAQTMQNKGKGFIPARSSEKDIEAVRIEIIQRIENFEKSTAALIDLRIAKLREEMIVHINAQDSDQRSVEMPEQREAIKGELNYPDSNYSRCLLIYNNALRDQDAQSSFRQQYSPIQIDIPNALQRRLNQSLEPIFKSSGNGILMVVELNDDGKTSYLVFPHFNLAVTHSNIDAAAINTLFKCPNFDPSITNKVAEVKEPAHFRKKGFDTWEFVEGQQGLLIFSNAED